MNRGLELRLIDQALAQLRSGRTHLGDRQGSEPIKAYLDPDRHRQEVASLFRQFPLGLAHGSEIAAAGQYVLRTAAGVSVILMRGQDGIARAFLNACRHRGAQLLDREKGCHACIVCPYHAWTYRSDGALIGMPGAEGFRDLDPGKLGLTEFPSIERYGVVWVVLTARASPDWACWFQPVDEELSALQLGRHVVFGSRELVLQAGWKAVNDAFMEGYHFRFVHRDSVYPLYFDNQGLFHPLGVHYRYVLPHRSILALPQQPRESWQLRAHSVRVYQLFPGTTIQVLPDHVFLHILLPEGPERSVVRNIMLIPSTAASDAETRHWQANLAMVCAALDEDHAMAERVQRGIASGLNADLHFGLFEQGITHMHETTAAALRGDLCRLISPIHPDEDRHDH